MKNMNISKKQKLIAVLLVVCMLVQVYINVPNIRAEDVALSATENGYVSINGINIKHEATLTEKGEGLFELDVTLHSTYSELELNQSTVSAENGIYPITHSGWYLVELWGGKGAAVAGAGKGGNEGYVYTKMYLEVGQTLFYSLGGNGVVTEKSHAGGGANGTGGGHGMVGGYAVGGGGGYSAVYLYDVGEVTGHHKTTISEADRISKYVMIAGGGGGGGATPGMGSVVGTADGGAGGSVLGASGTVSGDNVVSGTYFSGSNGKSAGTSTSYIGKGGTYEPGKALDSLLGLTDSKAVLPDNWYGTIGGNGGAGGTGELRGGGGGAGFAGGSGGMMTSVLIPSNVGGGGGGSSFIASDINEKSTSYSLSAGETDHLLSTNPSETGGAVSITYLKPADESIDFLNNISIEFCLSPYITLVTNSAVMEDYSSAPGVTFGWELHNGEANHEKITLSDISLLDTSGDVGGGFHLSFSFTNSHGFMGGNNVPLFRDGTGEEYACPFTLIATVGEEKRSAVIDLGEDCGAVNLPLQLEAHAHDLESNAAGAPFTVDMMYYDHYADVRDNLENYTYEYDRIEEIGNYRIYNSVGVKIFDGDEQNPTTVTITPNSTVNYEVVLPVKLKTPITYAKVGDPIVPDKEGYVYLTETSIITVPGSRTEQLGKFLVTHDESLSSQEIGGETVYDYEIHVTSQTTKEHSYTTTTPGVNHTPDFNTTTTNEYEHKILVSGWYLIRLWGGNGESGSNSFTGNGAGGAGGTGGYLSGYVHLEAGDIVNIFMGVNGKDSSGSFNTVGGGGKHSRATLLTPTGPSGAYEETILMIAGGGGGGGKAYLWNNGKTGGDVGGTYSNSLQGSAANEYNYYDGKESQNGGLFDSDTSGGAAGSNYVNTERVRPLSWTESSVIEQNFVSDGLSEELKESFSAAAANGSAGYAPGEFGGGTVHVECYEITDDGSATVVQELADALTDYSISATVTKYFKVLEVYYSDLDAEKPAPSVSFTNNYGSDNTLSVSGIYPTVTTNESGATKIARNDFTVTLRVTPADDFKGGNDVPLFVDGVTLSHVQYEQDEETGVISPIDPAPHIVLEDNDAADYANVAIVYETLPELEAQTLFYTGGEGYSISDLYKTTGGDIPTIDVAEGDVWRYDYVKFVNDVWNVTDDCAVASDATLAPDHTTEYRITIGIQPKYAGEKATVIDVQKEMLESKTALIIVGHTVTFELDGLSHDMTDVQGQYVVEQGDNLTFTLAPLDEESHEIPRRITVSVGGEPLESGYSYDLVTGEVVVDASVITDNVHITATAKGKDYTIYFVYGETPDATTFTTVEQEYEAGKSIEGAFHTDTASHPVVEGYDFSWDWGEGVDVAPTVMPHNDLWVIGKFTPRVYTVIVHFVYENGSQAFDDQEEYVAYGKDYVVSIPALKGYLPYVGETVTAAVQGTMGTSDVEVTVEYRLTENTLTVIYQNGKTGEQIGDAETHTVMGDAYGDIPVKTKEGYTQSRDGITPDAGWTVIEGSITANGNMVVVYYLPNTYTVTFQVDGETYETRDVVYDGTYGYLSDGTYQAFGYPQKDRYTFEGWYLGETEITEESLVQTASDHAIEARMTEDTFTVTVKYQKEDGTKAFEDVSQSFNYGQQYHFVSPTLDGYTPDIAEVAGTVLGHDLVVIVTYYRDYPEDPQITVRVDWGTLRYTFKPGVWNPETHTYGDATYTPTDEGENTVTVTNEDSHVYKDSVKTPIRIIADYSYEPTEGYEEITAYYTEGNNSADTHISNATLSVGESKKVYVWMEGDFHPEHVGTYGVGSCTVTISAGGIQQ